MFPSNYGHITYHLQNFYKAPILSLQQGDTTRNSNSSSYCETITLQPFCTNKTLFAYL